MDLKTRFVEYRKLLNIKHDLADHFDVWPLIKIYYECKLYHISTDELRTYVLYNFEFRPYIQKIYTLFDQLDEDITISKLYFFKSGDYLVCDDQTNKVKINRNNRSLNHLNKMKDKYIMWCYLSYSFWPSSFISNTAHDILHQNKFTHYAFGSGLNAKTHQLL